jgi:UPF0042 nucleotide-binding protein
MIEGNFISSIIIVSGYSGAGKTVALRALEDNGFFCIDNLPIGLIGAFLTSVAKGHVGRRIGIGVDIRGKQWIQDAGEIIARLRSEYPLEILFLEAEREVLIRRFQETRRPHPLMAANGIINLNDAIDEEEKQLAALRSEAERIVDTSELSPHQLRNFIVSLYGEQRDERCKFSITIISFGFKYGTPSNLDLLFDVRFLPNPYFIPELRALTGTHKELIRYVLEQNDTIEYFSRLFPLIDFLVPRYIRERKTYLTIGIGCTGGRHRSPVIAEEVGKYIRSSHEVTLKVIHRDMENKPV